MSNSKYRIGLTTLPTKGLRLQIKWFYLSEIMLLSNRNVLVRVNKHINIKSIYHTMWLMKNYWFIDLTPMLLENYSLGPFEVKQTFSLTLVIIIP